MIILSVDSSSLTTTVALLKDEFILGEYTINFKREHSVILMKKIESLLIDCEIDISQVDGFVVSKGPGSFTGLRIGMATIKGLSIGLKKPYVSVSSLDGFAYPLLNFDGLICPIMDALRDNVFTALYENIDDELNFVDDYTSLSLDELINLIKDKNRNVIFVGDAVYKHKEYLKEHLPNAKFALNHQNIIKASSIGELGMKLLKEHKFDDLNSAPLYLKKPQAEIDLEQRLSLKNADNL